MVNVTLETVSMLGTSIADQIAATKLNDSMQRCVSELRTNLNGKKCNLHPYQNQEMAIYSDRNSYVHIDVISCCCDKFRELLQFVPKEPGKYFKNF